MNSAIPLTELGVVGLALLLCWEAVKAVSSRRQVNGSGRTQAQMISDLHEWHKKEDPDGVKRWYVKPSFERAIEKLADNHAEMAIAIRDNSREQKQTTLAVRALVSDIRSRPCIDGRLPNHDATDPGLGA